MSHPIDTDLKMKLQIIAEVDKGRHYEDVATEFKISKSAVGNIYRKRAKYQSSDAASDQKRSRQSKFPQVEAALVEWLKLVRSKNPEAGVSGPLLIEKAKQFAADLDVSDFHGSDGWLSNFKSRHGIVLKSIVGESPDVSDNQLATGYKISCQL